MSSPVKRLSLLYAFLVGVCILSATALAWSTGLWMVWVLLPISGLAGGMLAGPLAVQEQRHNMVAAERGELKRDIRWMTGVVYGATLLVSQAITRLLGLEFSQGFAAIFLAGAAGFSLVLLVDLVRWDRRRRAFWAEMDRVRRAFWSSGGGSQGNGG